MENYEEGLQGVINVNKNLEQHIETIENRLKSLRLDFGSNQGELRSVNRKIEILEDQLDEESETTLGFGGGVEDRFKSRLNTERSL